MILTLLCSNIVSVSCFLNLRFDFLFVVVLFRTPFATIYHSTTSSCESTMSPRERALGGCSTLRVARPAKPHAAAPPPWTTAANCLKAVCEQSRLKASWSNWDWRLWSCPAGWGCFRRQRCGQSRDSGSVWKVGSEQQQPFLSWQPGWPRHVDKFQATYKLKCQHPER